ncbi:MAG TPA: hypothetical protein VGW10_12790 [Solirubrobacteraceae bacterium]|nr:hypothetical protein [Solirubrobacteraceae bacterium]
MAVGVAGGTGCSDEQPSTVGPSEATFTVPGSPEPPAPVPSCPRGGVRPTGPDARVEVADLRGPSGAAPRTLQTAREVTVRCIRWTSWGEEEAQGEGVARVLECTPTCAAGRLRHAAADVALSGRRVCDGVPFYDTARVRLRGMRAPAAYVEPPC